MNEYPEILGQDQLLTHIHASHNKLGSFPAHLLSYRMLEVLDLSNNQYLELPKDLQDLKFLRVLNVAHNYVEKLKLPRGTITHLNMSGLFSYSCQFNLFRDTQQE